MYESGASKFVFNDNLFRPENYHVDAWIVAEILFYFGTKLGLWRKEIGLLGVRYANFVYSNH